MHLRYEIPDQLTRLARHQAGVVSNEQAIGLGLSRASIARLQRTGAWVRLAKGIFVTHTAEPAWETLAWGGLLLGGPTARLGPDASAHQWRLGPAPDPIDILGRRRVKAAGPWRFILEAAGTRSAETTGSPPRLSAADTVIDRAATLRREGDVIDLVTTALRSRVTTVKRLQRTLDGRRRHPHRDLLTTLFRDAEGIESGLELEYLRQVERPHGLPVGTRQQPDIDLPHQTDVLYLPYGVITELDGRLGHEGTGAFRDMRRDNRHVLRGCITLRCGWWQVKDHPCSVGYQVYRLLVMGGYTGLFERCRRCIGVPEQKLADLAW